MRSSVSSSVGEEPDECAASPSAASSSKEEGEERERRTASSSKEAYKLKLERGASSEAGDRNEEGVLNMENYGELTMEAFEISEEFLPTSTRGACGDTFSYKRSVKKSILLNLGVTSQGGAGAERSGQDALDPYSKMDDNLCIVVYMSAIIGPGTFSLSKAVAQTGWVQGLMILVGLSGLHALMAQHVSRLPQLLECNVENYAGIGRACFNGPVGDIFVVLSITCWWCACVFNLFALMRGFQDVTQEDPNGGGASALLKLACLVPVIAFIWRMSMSQLSFVSKYSLYTMFAVAGVELICALSHLIYSVSPYSATELVKLSAWRSGTGAAAKAGAPVGFTRGLNSMLLAFAGVGFVPYAIAEMLKPKNAEVVVQKATFRIGAFYVTMGMLCYFGWGEDLLKYNHPLEKMAELGTPYRQLGGVCSVLFMVKAVCAYPIYFRPLLREMETATKGYESPSVDLQLPWAMRSQRRTKIAFRAVLACLTLGPLMVSGNAQSTDRLLADLFECLVVVVHIIAPASFIMKSVFIHRRRLQQRAEAASPPALARTSSCSSTTSRVSISSAGSEPLAMDRTRAETGPRGAQVAYYGGSLATHFAAACFVAVVCGYIASSFFWLKATTYWAYVNGKA